MHPAIVFDCFGVLAQPRLWGGYRQVADMVAYVERLRAAGYPTALLTNSSREQIDRLFSAEQRKKLFAAVVVSGEVGLAKPDPAVYELVCAHLGVVPDQAIMIDDSPHQVAGARAVGMRAIQHQTLVRTRAALAEMGVHA